MLDPNANKHDDKKQEEKDILEQGIENSVGIVQTKEVYSADDDQGYKCGDPGYDVVKFLIERWKNDFEEQATIKLWDGEKIHERQDAIYENQLLTELG